MVKIKSTLKEAKKAATKANLELAEYLKANKLDPTKDWTKDPKHGKKIKALMKIVRVGEKKAEDAEFSKLDPKKKLKKPETNPKVRTVKEQPRAYDYPMVDGKPMSTEMKKKFRQKMRSLLKANMDEKKASQMAFQAALEYKPSDKAMAKMDTAKKKVEKPKKEKEEKDLKKKVKDAAKKASEKSAKKKVKKVKKAKKEED